MKVSQEMIEETQILTGIRLKLNDIADRISTVPALSYPMETWLFSGGSISNGCSAFSNWFLWLGNDRYEWSRMTWVLVYSGKK